MQPAFIYEDPEAEESRQKRPRIITACDACRRRKHRCERTLSKVKCDACISAKLPCSTNDRERYFFERRKKVEKAHDISAKPNTPRMSSMPLAGGSRSGGSVTPGPRVDVQLFQVGHPGEQWLRPHAALMPAFISAFFSNMAHEYPFLSYDVVMQQYSSHSMSSLMENSIAALASPLTELSGDLYNISEGYGFQAKGLLHAVLVGFDSSLDILHSLILVSWYEYRTGRLDGFVTYGQLATEMAVQLGLSSNVQAPGGNPYETNLLRTTWHAVLRLNQAVQSVIR